MFVSYMVSTWSQMIQVHAKLEPVLKWLMSHNTARRISSVNTTASPSTLETGALRMMGMDPTTKGGPDAALASAWDPECVFMDKFTLSSAGDAVLKSDLFDE
jgi:hypothetical protein